MAMYPAPAHAMAKATYSVALAVALSLAMATGCAPVGVPWLTPTPEAGPYLADAVAAWTAAGVDAGAVYVGPGGAVVSMHDELPRGVRGLTRTAWDGRVEWVRVRRDAPARTWAHEVGHVLGADDSAPEGTCVMVPGAECDHITAEDLALAGW
jgi:uncharacterized protein with LGFP repeats